MSDFAQQTAMRASRQYPSQPLLGVGAFIFAADESLLMIQRATEPAHGRWSIPGGLVEVGETLHTAVSREVAEETGLLVEPVGIVEVVERILHDPPEDIRDTESRVRYHYVLVDYLCRITGGQLGAGSDAADARWVSAAEWQAKTSSYVEAFTRPVLLKAWSLWQQQIAAKQS